MTRRLLDEGKNCNFSANKGGASGSGVSFEDGIAVGEVEAVAACGVGVDDLFDFHVAFLQECHSAVVDEDIHFRIVGEDLMRSLRAVNSGVGIVDDKESDGRP